MPIRIVLVGLVILENDQVNKTPPDDSMCKIASVNIKECGVKGCSSTHIYMYVWLTGGLC